MSANLIANRYAKALLAQAGSDSELADQYGKFLETAASLFDVEEFSKVLKSPVMPPDLKKKLLMYAKDKSGAGDEIEKFCDVIVSSGRVSIVPEIKDGFLTLLNDRKGIAHAVVTTAQKLSDLETSQVKETLANLFKKKLTVENKIDQKILGGLVVEVGNYALDMSVKAKLNALSDYAQH
jgi:F-type H+-transporting ATPase subunit delta